MAASQLYLDVSSSISMSLFRSFCQFVSIDCKCRGRITALIGVAGIETVGREWDHTLSVHGLEIDRDAFCSFAVDFISICSEAWVRAVQMVPRFSLTI